MIGLICGVLLVGLVYKFYEDIFAVIFTVIFSDTFKRYVPKRYVPTYKGNIIAVGNPGAGKSTFLNSLASEAIFKSGINIGQGLTYQLDKRTNIHGCTFLDTPGLADEKLRKQAGKAISDGLRKGGKYKVVFFVTQEAGRVNAKAAENEC